MITPEQLEEAKRIIARQNQKKGWQKRIKGKSKEDISKMMREMREKGNRKNKSKNGRKKLSTVK